MESQTILGLGATASLLAVLLGAFGAHGLENTLEQAMLQRYSTAVDYHFYHALALILCGLSSQLFPARNWTIAAIAFLLGILLFSGSLYLYAITTVKLFTLITPVGGFAFIIGWAFLHTPP